MPKAFSVIAKSQKLINETYDIESSNQVYSCAFQSLEKRSISDETIHQILFWCPPEIEEQIISNQDKEVLALEADNFPENERKQILRRQKKALKRQKIANKQNVKNELRKQTLFAIKEKLDENFDLGIEALVTAATFFNYVDESTVEKFFKEIDSENPCVWKPSSNQIIPFILFSEIFEEVSESKKLNILLSLWEAMHNGRWWDSMTGVNYGGGDLKFVNIDSDKENLEEDTEDIRDLTANSFYEAFIKERIVLSESTKNLAANHNVKKSQFSKIHRMVNTQFNDQDTLVVSSYLKIPSLYKPESPLVEMCRTLHERINSIDDEGWKNAKKWEDLFPPSSIAQFNVSENVLKYNETTLDGVFFQAVLSEAALITNKKQLGNCTYGRLNKLKTGESTLWRLVYNNKIYNAQASDNHTRTIEIQGSQKYDRRHIAVPKHVNNAWEKFLKQLQD